MRFIIIAIALLVSSCVCWTAQHAQDPGCVVAHDIVDCTKDAAIPVVVSLFGGLIAQQGGSLDWAAIQAQLTSQLTKMGFKDGGCIIASLEAGLTSKPQASPEHTKRVNSIHSLLTDWKQHHGVANVKFKVIDAGGHESMQ